MDHKEFYAHDDDEGYDGQHGSDDDSENYPPSADFEDDYNDLDSDAINDFTSQELDKRIKMMKAKIKDLQEDELEYKRSPEKKNHSSSKKDYVPRDEESDPYETPKEYSKKENVQKRQFDEDSMDDFENDDIQDEKERLKDKIEDIKKAIQQYDFEEINNRPEESKIGRYYDEDDRQLDYEFNNKPKKEDFSKKTPPRKQWKDNEKEGSGKGNAQELCSGNDQFSKIKNSNNFQKFLKKEAEEKEKLKKSQHKPFEDDKRNDYEEYEGRGSSAKKIGARQTFGEKVQRFNHAIVEGHENEEQYNQVYDKNYPPNFGYDQPTKRIPQNLYQSNQVQNQQFKNRYSQAESMYGYGPPGAENELPGFSEQILSPQGQPPSYMVNQSQQNPNMMLAGTQENMNFKNFQGDPKTSLYNMNMASMNMNPGMMYPNQFQSSQMMMGANTFGNDPNMSVYAQNQPQYAGHINENYNTMNDPFMGVQKGEFDFLNEKLTKVQQMYDTLKKEYDEQKKFYDEALEARTNQLEEAENEVTKAKGELEMVKKIEIDLKAKNESFKFDNEMLNKRIETTSQDKTNASQREEGLLKQLDEVSAALKQKESIIEQKVDENFGLKQTIDQMKSDAEKSRRRIDTLEDLLRGKDIELSDNDKEINDLKGELHALNSKEKGLMKENEAIRNEITMIKGQLHGEKERNEHILRDLTGLKEALNQSQNREQSSRHAHENAKKEVESIKSQLTQANSYIQNQDNQLRSLQRDYDMIKSSNMDLKSQLESVKMQANYVQQIPYQPPTQYRPPPQFDSYPHYKPPPPQFTYSPPISQEQAYPAPPSYEAPKDYELSTPPRSRQTWEQKAGYSEQSYHSPPKEEFKQPISRNSYQEDSEGKFHSHSLDFQPKGQSSGVENAYQTKIHHSQSTMGSLLTWTEKENMNKQSRQQPARPPSAPEDHSYQPPARSNARTEPEQPSQW
jgi:hypothetical protein